MITRAISIEMQEAMAANPLRILAFIEINLTPVVRVHTGLGDRYLDGEKYIGIGELVSIGSVKEAPNMSANRVSINMKILDQALLTESLNTNMTGVEVYMHLAALDELRKITAHQMFFYEGEIANKTLTKGNLKKEIPYLLKLTVSDWYERWSRPANAARCTNAAQQALYPGDKFFDQVEAIASAPLSDIPIKGSGVTNPNIGNTGDLR